MNLPLTIVIFGATGDLFKKKLARAFFDLTATGAISEKCMLIGLSRKQLSHAEFRDITKEAIGEANPERVALFLQNVCYYSIDATDQFALESLRDILDRADAQHGACSNKLFYIATAPNAYEEIFLNISATGLSIPCASSFSGSTAWIRIIVEKPFGTDEKSARRLDEILGESFQEDQIYRIDHYLAKETVQNIYSFRFKNILFAPLWSRKYIDRVVVSSHEDEAKDMMLERRHFYDKVGALRDVGQNHLLELVSLIAMEEPDSDQAADIRKKRAQALSDTRFLYSTPDDLVLGQYDGYAVGDLAHSKTETYFKAKLSIENERWRNVPFWIEHGKALSDTKTGISVYFKKAKDENHPNVIHFNIQPEAQICVDMSAEDTKDGEVKKQMCFELGGAVNHFIYPYEKLLGDAIAGDQTLFVSTDEVREEWRITEEIQSAFSKTNLQIYQKGVREV